MSGHRFLLAIGAFSLAAAPLAGQRTRVHGYSRRDGTYVHPYTRSAPRSYATPRSYRAPRSYPTPRSYRAPRSYAPPRYRGYSPPRTYRAPRQPSTVPRDSRGRIRRSREARDRFMRGTGYPSGRPGYVVDHIVPLCAGGADAPSNMQWQTVEQAKIKDRQERAQCSHARP